MPQLPFTYLVASVIASLGAIGILMTTIMPVQTTDMHIEPRTGAAVVGETFTVKIIVESQTAVNVFKGLMRFNPNELEVTAIDYNTSIADLWAEEPWYSNGDGTLNFIGGTTRPGGFTGSDTLVTITFLTKAVGETNIAMDEVRILRHDGLGTDATVTKSVDAIFNIDEEQLTKETMVRKSALGPQLDIRAERPSTDLNGDGAQTIADTSIFMTHLARQNTRSDFTMDGRVTLADLSILMNAN